MANMNGKINLAKLEKTFITKGKKGQPLLVIDIQASHLFEGKDGNVYLDLNLWERDKPEEVEKYGLYSIKQSLPKEVRDADKENKVSRPYLGNAGVFVAKESKGAEEVEAGEIMEDGQDLPF